MKDESFMFPKLDVEGSDSNLLGKTYKDMKKVEKRVGEILDTIKEECMKRLDTLGTTVPNTRHKEIVCEDCTLKKEVRVAVTVKDVPAVTLLESHGRSELIDTNSTISIRKGVSPKIIPKELLKQMDEYFDIEVTKTVAKDNLSMLVQDGTITEEEFKSVTAEKETAAFKVV